MAFRFIHTADWQIGKPFDTIGGDVAPLLREARLAVIDRLATLAHENDVSHILVAGDVFDSATAKDLVLRQALQRLAAQPAVRWHLLPGNHDPATSHGIWHRIAAIGPPPNVTLHVTPRPHDLAPGVTLLPAPLRARAMHDDPTRWMDDGTSPDGTIRIGVAHGSVHGFGSEGDAAVPIMPSRVASAGLAYLALGDWHGTKRISDRIWYAGTPEPDQFADNDPGNALIVTIADARSTPEVRKVSTAHYTWTKRRLIINAAVDLTSIINDITGLAGAAARRLLSLEIDGTLPLVDAPALEAGLARLEGMVRYLAVDRRRLRIVAAAGEAVAGQSPLLARIAAELHRSAGTDDDRGRISARALSILATIAAESEHAS